jgi:uncharacterized coiled-coil protein SlyX
MKNRKLVDILNERIADLEAELAMRAKQLGVACEKHDLTHALACGRCLHEVAAENEQLRKDIARRDAQIETLSRWLAEYQAEVAALRGEGE